MITRPLLCATLLTALVISSPLQPTANASNAQGHVIRELQDRRPAPYRGSKKLSPTLIAAAAAWVIVFGGAASAISRAKGGSTAEGVFLGILLGPIGVWLEIIGPKSSQSGALKLCLACHSWCPSKAQICRYCGSSQWEETEARPE